MIVKRNFFASLILVAAVLLVGCGGAAPPPAAPRPQATPLAAESTAAPTANVPAPAPQASPTVVQPTAEPPTPMLSLPPAATPGAVPGATAGPGAGGAAPIPEGQLPAAVLSARRVVSEQLHVAASEIKVLSMEEVEWSDSCLGVHSPGIMCAQVITPGYRIVVDANGKQYELHTNQSGGHVVLAKAPKPQGQKPVVVWTGSGENCQTASISADAVAFGPCNGPLTDGQFGFEERPQELAHFLQTYAAFEADTPTGHVQFAGRGAQRPAPVEQRMIAEWAKLVSTEAAMGRSGASYGLAMAWHREGGIAGFCDDLTVYVTGRVYAASCKGAEPRNLGNGWLTAAQLDQVYRWMDSLKAFELEHKDAATADAMTIRLMFSGTGTADASDADKQAMQDFASQLFFELAQGTPTP